MKKTNDGGPAFPRPASEDRSLGDQPDGNATIDDQTGMSLLDWFAGQALKAIVSRFDEAASVSVNAPAVAEDAYRVARAMLAAREATI